MNLAYFQQLASGLEDGPDRLPAFYAEVEQAIRWLMDETFVSKDNDEKVRLASTEMRLRLVLDRFRKARVN